jgi:hypothetical protein
MKFSDDLLNKAISSVYDELAWKRADVFGAINELAANNYAILGGDVWAVTGVEKNINELTQIDRNKVSVGLIKGKNGQDFIFNWHTNREINESWDNYVLRCKSDTINAINNMETESTVADEFKDSIYYNLVYAGNAEFDKLNT